MNRCKRTVAPATHPVESASWRRFIGILCIVAAVSAIATASHADSVVEVGLRESGELRVGQNAILHDPDKSLSYQQAQQAYEAGTFQPLQTAGGTGLLPGAIWSHFTLRNPSDQTLTLHLEYVDHQLIALEAYQRPLQQGAPYTQIADLSLTDPFSKRQVKHNRFVFEAVLQPRQTTEFLVKYSADKAGYFFPGLRVWTPAELSSSHTAETGGIATGERIFYAYSVYSLAKIAVWATVLGYTHQYVITENFHWSYMTMSAAVTILCGLVFARMLLQTRQHTPRLDYVLLFMMGNAVFLFICGVFQLNAISVVAITIALLMYPAMIIIALARWRQGSPEAAVFALAWSFLVVGLVAQALRDLGHVPHNFFSYYWPPVASFTEMLTILGAMGIKVQRLRHQKEQAEHQYTRHLERTKAELEALLQAKAQAESEARTDALTGINNRRSFISRSNLLLSLAKRQGQPVSLLMLDLDHFKAINDNHGHAVGDEALRIFSRTVASAIRDSDVFGRLGGEEFGLLQIEDREGARRMAERLLHDIENLEIETDNGPLRFTVSIGMIHRRHEEDIEELLDKADRALYEAKANGRNQMIEYAWVVR